MKELIYALLVPAVVFYVFLTLMALYALADWSPEAEFIAFEDVQQCLEYAQPGEELVECEYMIEDHRKVADQNPDGPKLTKEQWDEYWELYVRSLNRERQEGQHHSSSARLEA